MKRFWTGATIRARLTAWYALVLTAMLLLYAAMTYVAVRHEFLEQLDERLHDDFEAVEGRLVRTPDGEVAWATDGHLDTHDAESKVYEVWSAAGEQVHRSGAPIALPPVALHSTSTAYRYETIVAGGERWRTLAAPVALANHNAVMRVSRSEERVHEELAEIQTVLMLGLPIVVALAGAGGYLLARRALAPIDHLASEAERITADRLHERLRVRNERDEIGRLTAVINQTFGRLEASFNQLRRFTADSSHELRTPLAVVRSIGESTVSERRSSEQYEEAIGSMLEEVDRMTKLVDTLLRLSHGDAGVVRLTQEPIALSRLVHDVGASVSVLAEERHQTLGFDVREDVIVHVDRLVLREALTNILDNAIKYSPIAGTVVIQVDRAGDRALITIADQGPGVPQEHRQQIFERFFRVDPSRARDSGGAGLGLAIAKWAVELHGGAIGVSDRPGGGAEFRIVLPIAPTPDRSDGLPERNDR